MNNDLIKVLKGFEAYLTLKGYSYNTIKQYLYDIQLLIKIIGVNPVKWSKKDIENAIEKLRRERNYRDNTINRKICSVKIFFNYLVNIGLVKENPAININLYQKRRKSKDKINYHLLEEEVKILMKTADSLRDKLIISLLYEAGLKIDELATLKWSNIDLEHGVIFVEDERGFIKRIVHLPKQTLHLLTEYHDRYHKLGEARVLGISKRTIQYIVKKLRDEASVKTKITPSLLTKLYEHRKGTSRRIEVKVEGKEEEQIKVEVLRAKIIIPIRATS